jgi:hypothetical protein
MDMTKGRGWFYIIGLIAGGVALAGYADFDAATGSFDLHPINLYDVMTTGLQTAGNALAALAVWRGWGRK